MPFSFSIKRRKSVANPPTSIEVPPSSNGQAQMAADELPPVPERVRA